MYTNCRIICNKTYKSIVEFDFYNLVRCRVSPNFAGFAFLKGKVFAI